MLFAYSRARFDLAKRSPIPLRSTFLYTCHDKTAPEVRAGRFAPVDVPQETKCEVDYSRRQSRQK